MPLACCMHTDDISEETSSLNRLYPVRHCNRPPSQLRLHHAMNILANHAFCNQSSVRARANWHRRPWAPCESVQISRGRRDACSELSGPSRDTSALPASPTCSEHLLGAS